MAIRRLLRLSVQGQVSPNPETINSQWMGESSLETLALHQSRTFLRPREGRWLQAPGTTFLDEATARILYVPTWLYSPDTTTCFLLAPRILAWRAKYRLLRLSARVSGPKSETRNPETRRPLHLKSPKRIPRHPALPRNPTQYTRHTVSFEPETRILQNLNPAQTHTKPST